tara:strand:+ start:1462 stop:1599 length:138 start_codon:yes stop_codon:yes gene_type:complete
MPKSKKKLTYKQMMAQILKSKPKEDEKKTIKQNTGGGEFKKVVPI